MFMRAMVQIICEVKDEMAELNGTFHLSPNENVSFIA